MDRDTGARILEAALSLEREIGKLDMLISQLNDEGEKKEFVRALGDIIGILTKDFVFRISREHPELDPDR